MKDTRKIFVGSKFFRYNNESDYPEVIRIRQVFKERVRYRDADGNTKSMSKEYLFNNYQLLTPDGIIMAVIAKVGEVDDAIITLWKMNDTDASTPYAVCRQLIQDVFTNNTRTTDNISYVGVSISKDTCPANIRFNDVLACNSVEYQVSIAIYLDDTLDMILSLFNNRRFDNALRSASRVSSPDGMIFVGFASTLKDLLKENHFMYDFRKCFNIVEIPFKVDESTEALSSQNILFLEDLLKVNIMETYLIKYTKEIDLKTIKRDYILAASIEEDFQNIYIVGYDKADGEYVPRSAV